MTESFQETCAGKGQATANRGGFQSQHRATALKEKEGQSWHRGFLSTGHPVFPPPQPYAQKGRTSLEAAV